MPQLYEIVANLEKDVKRKDKRIAELEDQLEREKTLFMMESETHKYDLKRIAELEAALESIKRVAGPQGSALADIVWKIADAAMKADRPKEE